MLTNLLLFAIAIELIPIALVAVIHLGWWR